jgi:DNA sulfur modification protein DndB
MADYVPALKAKMGDWQYYVTVMKLGKIARECRLAEEIHANEGLDDLIQRAIQDRVQKEMVPYLTKEPQRFYGALVVAVYGGTPEFSPVTVDEHTLIDDKEDFSYGFGLLRFDGSQIYYALDGQHRLKSIQEAIRINPDLAKEEISVIILKHETSPKGLERTRRLFSTLNRRAKPTSSGMNIAIDEDDPIAIVTRRLVKENDILKKLVSAKLGSKQLSRSKSDDPYITTLPAFYETNEILLSAYQGGLNIDKSFKQFRPSNDKLEGYYDYLEKVWMLLLNSCPQFDSILSGKKQPGDIRKRTDLSGNIELDDNGKQLAGGNVFARPIGQFILAEVFKIALLQNKNADDLVGAIMNNIAMDIDSKPWVGIIWNPSTQRIQGTKSERSLLANIICHALGLKIRKKVKELKQEYCDSLGDPNASLLKSINWSGNQSKSESEQ